MNSPIGNLPDIGKCTFETGGFQDFIGSANISHDRIDHSITYDTPIGKTIREFPGIPVREKFLWNSRKFPGILIIFC